MQNFIRIISLYSLTLYYCTSYSQNRVDSLLKGFVLPPSSAKPLVLWHWMNGNVNKVGIAKDLA